LNEQNVSFNFALELASFGLTIFTGGFFLFIIFLLSLVRVVLVLVIFGIFVLLAAGVVVAGIEGTGVVRRLQLFTSSLAGFVGVPPVHASLRGTHVAMGVGRRLGIMASRAQRIVLLQGTIVDSGCDTIELLVQCGHDPVTRSSSSITAASMLSL
jgi:hypothetical protein